MSEACQVDFYLLASAALDPQRLACKLALMAWERGHTIDIVTTDGAEAEALDRLMWACPEGRFLPHERAGQGARAPIRIHCESAPESGDVVINLTPQALARPQAFRRLLEIVPHRPAEREASRDKFRAYRDRGLAPATHPIS